MNKLASLVLLVVAVAGCDNSSLTSVENEHELSDSAVLGAKPQQVPVNEVSGSGWSGTATFSRDNRDQLFFRITATGDPNTIVSLCAFSNSNSSAGCQTATSGKTGRVSASYRRSLAALGPEGMFKILLGDTDTVLAASDTVTFP